MGLFGKKKRGTPPPCCGRTPETAVWVGADLVAARPKPEAGTKEVGGDKPRPYA